MRTVIFIPIAKFTRLLALLSLVFCTLSVLAASTVSFDCPATVTATSANGCIVADFKLLE